MIFFVVIFEVASIVVFLFISIYNSFRDGRVFCALVNYLSPTNDVIDLNVVQNNTADDNMILAFRVAEEQFGVSFRRVKLYISEVINANCISLQAWQVYCPLLNFQDQYTNVTWINRY